MTTVSVSIQFGRSGGIAGVTLTAQLQVDELDDPGSSIVIALWEGKESGESDDAGRGSRPVGPSPGGLPRPVPRGSDPPPSESLGSGSLGSGPLGSGPLGSGPLGSGPLGSADGFSYRLALRDGHRTRQFSWTDRTVPPSVQPLISELSRKATPERPKR